MFNHKVTFSSKTAIKSAFGRIFSTVLLASLALVPALGQAAEGTNTLAEHTPPQVLDGTAIRVSHYNPALKLRLTLAIQPPHMAEEEEFLRELTDRTSPNFHQFLTPEEWNARFAPSAEDEQAVVDWAFSQGFTVTHRFNHRLLVDLEGTAGLIEKAFGVTLNQYQLRDEVDFSNDRDPVIPAHLQGIVYNIQGLNNIQHDHNNRPGPQPKAADYAEGPAWAQGPAEHADAKAPRPNSAPAGTSNDSPNSTLFTNGYANPTEIFSSQVYNYDGLQNLGHCCNPHNDSGGTPNVSNIAIAAFGNFNGSDVTGFQAAYPYLAYNYQTHFIDGSIDCTSDPGDCPSGETTQDVEWTIATANSFGSSNDTAKIYPYIGANYNNSTFTDMYGFMLSDNLARVFTTSWSCTEVYGCSTGTMDARHTIFDSMLGQGWTLIAASGDRGSSDDCYLNKNTNTYNTAHESAAYPGSDYDVLAAGGTYLQVYNDGSWDYEHAWAGGTSFGSCGHNNGGSGGGISSYYGRPGFEGYSTWTAVSKRQTPDISLNAIGIGQNLYINGNLQCCANGTSIVAPELAGFFAQENAYLNYIGNVCGSGGNASCTPVGQPMQFFYPAAYYNDASHFPFYDMTGAYCNSNDVTIAQSLGSYCTHAGWDNVTGWGSANMLQLAWAINWYLIPANGTPSINWTSGPAKNQWYNSDQQLNWTIDDYGGGTFPGTGIAGFTQGWDSIPPDSTSKPHGGTGDTFWSGPEYPTYTNGCMTLVGNPTCPGGVSQGCHTAHVRGWNNQGWTTGDQTYGPVCYDTVAPTISASTNPATSGTVWVDKSVTVTLTASDPGGSNASGIYKTYYAINTISCYPGSLSACTVYSGPFTISTPGQTYIYIFTEDNAGNFSSNPYIWISVDETAPTTTSSLSGIIYSGSTYETTVQVTLNASDTGGSGVKNTYYQLDGGSTITYTGSAFTVSALGSHSVKYWSVDNAGNTEATHTTTFTIHSPTTATLVATPNPSLLGGSVKMTATVTATLSGTPTGTVTFWNGATNLGTGTLSGGVATLSTTALPAGALTLQVSYPVTGNFLATNSAPFDETVNQHTTTTLTSSLNPSNYGQAVTFTAQVTPSNSGTPTGTVSFYDASTLMGTVALNSSDIATFTTSSLATGTDSIKGVYSGDSTYLTSTSSVLSETVKHLTQTINFPAIAAQRALTTVTLSATASSGLTVSYTSLTTSICTVTGNTASLLEPGTCTLEATQAGDSDYAAAPAVKRSFAVGKDSQTISFAAIPTQTYGASPFTVSATASSGLPVSFASTTLTVCTVSGSTVTLVSVGTCTLEATQAGNSDYAAALAVTRRFAVGKGSQIISFAAIPTQTYGASPFTVSATASSGLPVSFASTTLTVCTVSGNTITLVSVGTCSIEATQAGNAYFAAARAATRRFTVAAK